MLRDIQEGWKPSRGFLALSCPGTAWPDARRHLHDCGLLTTRRITQARGIRLMGVARCWRKCARHLRARARLYAKRRGWLSATSPSSLTLLRCVPFHLSVHQLVDTLPHTAQVEPVVRLCKQYANPRRHLSPLELHASIPALARALVLGHAALCIHILYVHWSRGDSKPIATLYYKPVERWFFHADD
jgi:hypothetical protein